MPVRKPQRINETSWYYEYPTCMLLVHEVRDASDGYIRTDSIQIQWRKIAVSLKRSYRPRNRRTRK